MSQLTSVLVFRLTVIVVIPQSKIFSTARQQTNRRFLVIIKVTVDKVDNMGDKHLMSSVHLKRERWGKMVRRSNCGEEHP